MIEEIYQLSFPILMRKRGLLILPWMLIVLLVIPTTTVFASSGTWESLGPGGSSITALSVAPSDPAILFIECDEVGVYASGNSGDSWEEKGYFVACGNVCDLLINLTDPDIVLALEGFG